MDAEYMQIPVSEFERLHVEIRTLTDMVHKFAEENTRLRARGEELERAKGPIGATEFRFLQDEVERLRSGWQNAEGQIAKLQADVLDLTGELTAADQRIKELDAENERLIRALSHS